LAERTLGLATILNPVIGYEAAARIAKEALASGKPVRDLVVEKGILSKREADEILNPYQMTSPQKKRRLSSRRK